MINTRTISVTIHSSDEKLTAHLARKIEGRIKRQTSALLRLAAVKRDNVCFEIRTGGTKR